MTLNAGNLDYRALNEAIRTAEAVEIDNCLGQRFIGAGMKTQKITVNGVPGNALGAYLAGAEITVNANAQDAVGDTMNDGKIIIHGDIGDAAGYAMRGGIILIRGNAGYRVGIHMKQYREKKPAIVIGGKCGSFLGEYQAGGVVVVLGMTADDKPLVGNFPCTGMHGGKVYLRGAVDGIVFPKNVTVSEASDADREEIAPLLDGFGAAFGYSPAQLWDKPFYVVVPDTSNPYKQMYVAN